jgi:hypothetical protein
LYTLPPSFAGRPRLRILSSIHVKLLAPRIQFCYPEPDRAAHHSKMGNLLPLDISTNEGRADPKKLRRGIDIDRSSKILRVVMLDCVAGPAMFSVKTIFGGRTPESLNAMELVPLERTVPASLVLRST